MEVKTAGQGGPQSGACQACIYINPSQQGRGGGDRPLVPLPKEGAFPSTATAHSYLPGSDPLFKASAEILGCKGQLQGLPNTNVRTKHNKGAPTTHNTPLTSHQRTEA